MQGVLNVIKSESDIKNIKCLCPLDPTTLNGYFINNALSYTSSNNNIPDFQHLLWKFGQQLTHLHFTELAYSQYGFRSRFSTIKAVEQLMSIIWVLYI